MKTKEKTNSSCWIGITLIIIIILVVGGIIYYKMPKQVCHDEETIVRIKAECSTSYQYIPANAERICDDGVKGATEKIDYDSIVYDCNFDEVDRYCMYRQINKVCEVVYR